MFSEGNAANPDIVMTVWYTFFSLNFLGLVRQPSADNNSCFAKLRFLKKCAKHQLLSAEGFRFSQFRRTGPVTPDQVTQQNSLQRAGGPYM